MVSRLPFYLVFAAFILRLLYLCQLAQSPFFYPARGLDPFLYHNWALSLLGEGDIGQGVFRAMPLYPYLLALFYAVSAKNLFFVHLLQLLLGSLNCYLIYLLGNRLGGRSLGLLASFLLAFCGISMFYEAMLVPSVVIASLLLVLLLLFSGPPTVRRWLLGGFVWGLAALAHAGILLWAPFIFFWTFWRETKGDAFRKSLLLAAPFLALFLVLASVVLRNRLVAGEPVFLTAHGGINFFIGNNPEATGRFQSHFSGYTSAEHLFEQSKRAAEGTVGHSLTDGESSRYWFRQGIRFIRENPRAFLGLLWRKWSLFWNGYEIPDVEDFYFFRKEFFILKLAPFQTVFLSPLALFGILLSLRHGKRFLLLYGVLFSMVGGLLLFFVNSRYRAPLLPLLALFAAYALLRMAEFLRQKRLRRLLVSLFLLFHLALWTGTEAPFAEGGIGHYNIGIAYTRSGLFEKAIQEFERALLTTHDEGMVQFALGNAYFGKEDYEKAIAAFREAIRLHPDFADAHFNLGVALVRLHRETEAERALLEALRLDPEARDIREELRKLKEGKR